MIDNNMFHIKFKDNDVLHEGIGFERLSCQEQQAYKVLLKGFLSMASSLDCSQINEHVDLTKVFYTVLGDNPSIIYFDKTRFEVEKSNYGKRIILADVYLITQAKKMNLELEETASKIVMFVKTASQDEYSLLIKLYEYLQKNIRYDKDELNASTRGISKNPASHNAYGALVNSLAVCDGFSSAFALLAQKLGFECMVVVGRSLLNSTTLENHAWNIIKIQNKYYHMDITWDTLRFNQFSGFSYDYFALNDEKMAYDHNWDKSATPACLYNDFSYYNIKSYMHRIRNFLKKIEKVFKKEP